MKGTTNKDKPFQEGEIIEFCDDRYCVASNHGSSGTVSYAGESETFPFLWVFAGESCRRVKANPTVTETPVSKFIDLCDTLDNTCLGNGMDDMVSVGRSQYMALINYANEMRGE
jgi:hypothetical protein